MKKDKKLVLLVDSGADVSFVKKSVLSKSISLNSTERKKKFVLIVFYLLKTDNTKRIRVPNATENF